MKKADREQWTKDAATDVEWYSAVQTKWQTRFLVAVRQIEQLEAALQEQTAKHAEWQSGARVLYGDLASQLAKVSREDGLMQAVVESREWPFLPSLQAWNTFQGVLDALVAELRRRAGEQTGQ